MKFTEIALRDSSPRRICEYLTIICGLRVKPIEQASTEHNSVVVGKILKLLSIEMESRDEMIIIFMREIRTNYDYGCNFKALILGPTARMLIQARPQIGDRLAFSNGRIFSDICFTTNTPRCLYRTTHTIQIGPGEEDNLFLVRKESSVSQPENPVSPSEENNDPVIQEIFAKLRHLEGTVYNLRSNFGHEQPFSDIIETYFKNSKTNNSFLEKNYPTNVFKSAIDCSIKGPSNVKNSASRSDSPQKKVIQSENKIISNKSSSHSISEKATLQNSAQAGPSKPEFNLKQKTSKLENRKLIDSTRIYTQSATNKKRQQMAERVEKISNPGKLHSTYVYDSIEKVKRTPTTEMTRINLFGVVYHIIKPLSWTQKGRRHMICQLIDDSKDGENLLVCHFFTADDEILKHIECGDVLRLHRVKLESNYEGVDGRVFFNNDILLFKSKSDVNTPVKTAHVTLVTDAQKKRVKQLWKWYENYDNSTEEEPEEETEEGETGREMHILNESRNSPSKKDSVTNALNFGNNASTSLNEDLSNKIDHENINQMKKKKNSKNDYQMKKKHLYVPKKNDHLSIACDDIIEISPARKTEVPIIIDDKLNHSFESYMTAKNGFQTSTPIRDKKIEEKGVQVNCPVTSVAQNQSNPKSNKKSVKEPLAPLIIATSSSDTSTVINTTSRKRRYKEVNNEPSFTKRKTTTASELRLSTDEGLPTIKSTEVIGRNSHGDLTSETDLELSSDIDLNSLEAENLLGGSNDQAKDGSLSPTQATSDSGSNSSFLAKEASFTDSFLLKPDQIPVKAYITHIRPDPNGDMLDIVSGFCYESCHGLSIFTNLRCVRQDDSIVLTCPTCYITRGEEKRVSLTFMITFDLFDLKNGFKLNDVTLLGNAAEQTFGCSAETFIKDEKIRKAISKMLKCLLHESDCIPTLDLRPLYPPRFFILSPHSVLKKVFMIEARCMQTNQRNVVS